MILQAIITFSSVAFVSSKLPFSNTDYYGIDSNYYTADNHYYTSYDNFDAVSREIINNRQYENEAPLEPLNSLRTFFNLIDLPQVYSSLTDNSNVLQQYIKRVVEV